MSEDRSGAAATPFHPGELAVQERLGYREKVTRYGPRMIGNSLTTQHAEFFAALPWVIVGSLDGEGRPWASLVPGRPGFIEVPDATTLAIGAPVVPGDPLGENLEMGAAVGLLGIELHTKRRNRANGRITVAGPDGFTVGVEQAFGNCPQYIRPRLLVVRDAKTTAAGPPAAATTATGLDKADRMLVERAETFFIASTAPGAAADRRFGVDVSHRGGGAGFVRAADASTLVFPDYAGNRFYNTLGNLEACPKAGLLFVDFAVGDLLMVTGAAEILWDASDPAARPPIERRVRITVDEVRRIRNALPATWAFEDLATETGRPGG